MAKKRLTPGELVLMIESLQRTYDPRKPVMVFPPGWVKDVTVSMAGNLVICFSEYKEKKGSSK